MQLGSENNSSDEEELEEFHYNMDTDEHRLCTNTSLTECLSCD